MLQDAYTFNGFTTNDIAASRKFYADTLGLQVTENKMRILQIKAAGGNLFIFNPKEDHEPAKFTVLNFEVKDIKEVVNHLIEKGITFEQYDEPIRTDKKGICWDNEGPNIAWFKDNAGNILSVIEE